MLVCKAASRSWPRSVRLRRSSVWPARCWAFCKRLIAIGVAGQASIDKVAGPVGEALIMTFLGLAAAVPAVLLYNYLVRRNKVITEKLRAFAGDLQSLSRQQEQSKRVFVGLKVGD